MHIVSYVSGGTFCQQRRGCRQTNQPHSDGVVALIQDLAGNSGEPDGLDGNADAVRVYHMQSRFFDPSLLLVPNWQPSLHGLSTLRLKLRDPVYWHCYV